jgi:hypothetical protein
MSQTEIVVGWRQILKPPPGPFDESMRRLAFKDFRMFSRVEIEMPSFGDSSTLVMRHERPRDAMKMHTSTARRIFLEIMKLKSMNLIFTASRVFSIF